MTQDEQQRAPSGQAPQTYRVTKHMAVSFTISVNHASDALGMDERIQVQITDERGVPLLEVGSIGSVDLSTVNDGIMIELLGAVGEEPGPAPFARALARWQ